MHAAKLHKSDRLQRVHTVLKAVSPRWFSTRDIIEIANVCAVSSIASELRANGVNIECRREGNVWSYRLAP